MYLQFVHQKPKLLRNDKGDKINVGNIPCRLFYGEVFLFQYKANI